MLSLFSGGYNSERTNYIVSLGVTTKEIHSIVPLSKSLEKTSHYRLSYKGTWDPLDIPINQGLVVRG